MAEIFVCAEGDIPDGDVRIVKVGAKEEVGIYRRGDAYYAYRNRCVHQGGPVCEGEVMPRVEDVLDDQKQWLGQRFVEDDLHIVCPWHGYEFRLENGVCATDERIRLKRFEVTRRDNGVFVVV